MGIRFPSRHQEPFYLAMEALANKGLLNLDQLRARPISIIHFDEDVSYVEELLNHLPVCRRSFSDKVELQGLFPAPVIWLAKLITRSCTDFPGIISLLCTTKLLGDFDKSYASTALQNVRYKASFTVADTPRADYSSVKEKRLPAFGFCLPRDFSSPQPFAIEFCERYNRAHRVFEKCFGAGSWGDATLIHESIDPWLEDDPTYPRAWHLP